MSQQDLSRSKTKPEDSEQSAEPSSAAPQPGPKKAAAPVKRVAFYLLAGLVLWFLATEVLGSLILAMLSDGFAGDPASGDSITAIYTAAGLSLFVTLLLPAVLAIKFARTVLVATRTFAGWNLVISMALLLLLTAPSKKALWVHGAWPAALSGSEELAGAQKMVQGLAAVLPGEDPIDKKPPTDEPEPDTGPYSAQEVFARAVPSVAFIGVRRPFDDGLESVMAKSFGLREVEGHGSGFVVSDDGLIVTNHHVVGEASSAYVRLQDGRSFAEVQLVADDPANDLSLLKVKASGLRPLPLATREIAVGSDALAIGSPLGLDFSLTKGIVSAKRDWQGTKMLQMQTDIAPGSSGGPVVNDYVELVGVSTATRGAGLNMAVQVQHVRDLLAQARQAKTLAPWKLNLQLAEMVIDGKALPTTRAGLESMAKFAGMTLNGCVDVSPTTTHNIRLEIERKPFGDHNIVSDLNETEQDCIKDLMSLMAMMGSAQLSQDAEFKSVQFRYQLLPFQAAGAPEPSGAGPAAQAATGVVVHSPKPTATLALQLVLVEKVSRPDRQAGPGKKINDEGLRAQVEKALEQMHRDAKAKRAHEHKQNSASGAKSKSTASPSD